MKKKELLSVTLALGLALSFAGCAGKSTPPPKTEPAQPTTQATPKTPASQPADVDKMMEQGIKYIETGDYANAIKTYQEILTATDNKDTKAMAYYNLACTYSLMKEKAPALEYLEKSIKNGYDNRESIENDKDLDFLRAMPEYKTIIDSIPLIQEIQPTPEDEKSQQEALKLIEQYRGIKYKSEPKYKIMAPDQFQRAYGGNAKSILGFYRWDDKTLYLQQGLDPVKSKGVRIHETFHAIQDQLFNTGATQKSAKTTDDYYTIKAVIEGDATLTFIECMPDSRAGMMIKSSKPWRAMGKGEPLYDNSESGEAAMRMRFLDYSLAALFIKAIKDAKGWEGVNAIYTHMPASTEQVLHPEKYIQQNDPPIAVTIPDLSAIIGTEWKVFQPDVQGEFAILLNLLTNPKSGPLAEEASAGWGGDSFIRIGNPTTRQLFTIHKTVWDTPKDAKEFLDAAKLTLERGIQPGNKMDYITLLNDLTVLVIRDIPQDLSEKVVKAISDGK